MAKKKPKEQPLEEDSPREPEGSETSQTASKTELPAVDADEDEFQDPAGASGFRVEVARQDDAYYFMVYSRNGRQIMTGPEPHKRLNDLKSTVREYIKGDPPFIRLY